MRTGWRYITADDDVELYDASGKLLSITHRGGRVETLVYSDGTSGTGGGFVLDADGNATASVLPVGLLIRVSDEAGRSLKFGYDASSRVVKMTDPAGGVFHYRYDAANNLASVTYPDATPDDLSDNPKKTYLYNEPALTSGANLPYALTGIIDEHGTRYASYGYDASGRAISSEHAGGAERVTLNYSVDPNTNNGNGTTIVTDARNTARTYNFQTILGVVKNTGVSQPGGSGCGPAASNLTYDANGNIATRTDFNGNQTRFSYDLARNLETSRTEGLTSAGVNTSATRTTQTEWHANFRLPTKITEALGQPEQRVTTFSYDSVSGNVLNKTLTATATAQTRSWTYTYTSTSDGTLPNLLKTIDGPRTDVADVTAYAYYPNGDLKSVTNALGQLTQFTEYDAHGRPLTVIDPNSVSTTLSYTPRGWLASRSVAGRSTLYKYDNVGQLKRITFADGSYIDYTYDAAHRLTDIADTALNRIHYTLDAMGNRIQEEVYDASNTLNLSKRRVFDALNRLWQDIAAFNQNSSATTTYGYDANGNLKTVTDPLNRSTTFNYDALNRLSQSMDAINLNNPTRYEYDALDQLTGVTDPRTLNTHYQINALGNSDKETGPDRGVTQRGFDAAGNLISRTDARGIPARYGYDALNRLSSITYPSAGESVSYIWDTYPGCSFGQGRLCRIIDNTGASTFAYDAQGNLSKTTRVRHGVSYVTQYGYDLANRLVTQILPTGETLSLTRNSVGRINSLDATYPSGSKVLAQQLSYNGAGQLVAQTLGNGVKQSLTFDLNGRLANQGSNRAQGDGDLNGDGLVDVADVALAERIALGLLIATPDQLARADVAPATPNGVIDAADVARIRRKALGLEFF